MSSLPVIAVTRPGFLMSCVPGAAEACQGSHPHELPCTAGAAGAGVAGPALSGSWRSLTRCCLIWLSVGFLATSPLALRVRYTSKHTEAMSSWIREYLGGQASTKVNT